MKRRKFVKGILLPAVAGCVALAASAAFAGSSPDLFIQKCGACHKRGGEAAPVNPADKAGLVWEKYFKRGRHPVSVSKSMSDDEFGTVLEYLKDHAADSDQPEAAAIPK